MQVLGCCGITSGHELAEENAAIPAADKAINHVIYHYEQPYDYEGVMQGSPPPSDQVVTRENLTSHPRLWRWAMQHMRELCSTQTLSRGIGPVTPLPVDIRDIKCVPVADGYGGEIALGNYLEQTDTDGFIVLHQGKVVTEQILVRK